MKKVIQKFKIGDLVETIEERADAIGPNYRGRIHGKVIGISPATECLKCDNHHDGLYMMCVCEQTLRSYIVNLGNENRFDQYWLRLVQETPFKKEEEVKQEHKKLEKKLLAEQGNSSNKRNKEATSENIDTMF